MLHLVPSNHGTVTITIARDNSGVIDSPEAMLLAFAPRALQMSLCIYFAGLQVGERENGQVQRNGRNNVAPPSNQDLTLGRIVMATRRALLASAALSPSATCPRHGAGGDAGCPDPGA